MSTSLPTTKESSSSDGAVLLRGRRLTQFTTDELARVCLETTGKPLSTRETLDLVRSGVHIELSPEDKAYVDQHQRFFEKKVKQLPSKTKKKTKKRLRKLEM